MSRWQDQFHRQVINNAWEDLKEQVKALSADDETVTTDVEEISRLKKVIEYLKKLTAALDPELVPLSLWVSFQEQANNCLQQVKHYENNRKIQHVVNANSHADNLLSYIRPYVIDTGEAAIAASSAFTAYQESISQSLKKFEKQAFEYRKKFKEASNELSHEKVEIETLSAEIKETHEVIERLRKEYFEGIDGEDAVQKKIDDMVSSLEQRYHEVSAYHAELLLNGSDSIKSQVSEVRADVEQDSNAISELLGQSEKEVKFLQSFYKEVAGTKDEEGNQIGGLKSEIAARQEDLDRFQVKQEERYKALNSQIEELLPGATSAGLAASYRAMRKSFTKPIKQYSYLFYISVFVLSLTAFLSTVDSFWTEVALIRFIDVTDYKNFLSNLAHKLPIILPVLWLAIFASKRRSEALRLQQEYSHKESLAKSYQNFKKQVDELQSSRKEELLEKLLGAAIDAVAMNASDTLDKKHGDNTPANEGFEKTIGSLEKLKNMLK